MDVSTKETNVVINQINGLKRAIQDLHLEPLWQQSHAQNMIQFVF
jgi:hypothetical protein